MSKNNPSLSKPAITTADVHPAVPAIRSRLPALITGLVLLAAAGISHAAATAYEPFDYPAEAPLLDGTAATGDGFSGNWTCGLSGWILAGLSYSGLPVSGNAMRSPPPSRQFVSLETPLSGGTKWISFLYQTSPGNPGANLNGVYFPNSNATCLYFGFGLSPYSGTQGQLGLASITTAGTTAQGASSSLELLGLGTYGDIYLVVLEIEFNTSGNNDTVTVYLNPVAGQSTPGVAAAGTHSAFDVGTISGVGMNVTGAGEIIVDEIRVGDSYADVVGAVVVPPDTPTGLSAVPGSNSVALSWTAATGSPAGYNVKRSIGSGGPYVTLGSTTEPTVTYNDAVLGGQTYYYVVSAENSAGESTNSAQVAVTPILAPPDIPDGLVATPGDALVSLSWNPAAFATGYTVKRGEDIAGPYSIIGSTTDPVVTYDDTAGLVNGNTYYYVISATGAGGPSGDSTPISATPVGPLPLIADIEMGVGITWYASNGITYQVQWAAEDIGTNTVWNNLGSAVIGEGTTNTVFDAAGAPHNVHRVLSIQ
jgi:fibronectin type 3 domain-containing protein